MEKHFTFSDDEFERLFEDKTLEPEVFTHEAHIRLAWIHITKYGSAQACDNVVSQLLAYVKMLLSCGNSSIKLLKSAEDDFPIKWPIIFMEAIVNV